ncbi:MAG TPA: helix-turn-helix domain-containing protein [Xanthobacteraceae bacterium]|nr:helix-turn-helix domain-containing protein [Xanthobacteraceae bacterium]
MVDGRVWTSAGVTTGIDMALAMVEHDLGAGIANGIARRLVLYARRPGHQSQFSPLLPAQTRGDQPFAELIDWMQRNLEKRLDVPTLATRASQSVRSFHRRFSNATGETPAHFVELIRLDAARALLGGDLSLKAIAARVGFGSAARLGAAFARRFGVTPRLFARCMERRALAGRSGGCEKRQVADQLLSALNRPNEFILAIVCSHYLDWKPPHLPGRLPS